MSELSFDASAQPTHDELLDRLRSATIGKYDIYAEVGRGGMAVVYLALDLALNRKVAIKAVLPEVAGSSGAYTRFHREVRTSASLSHPNIVPIFSVGDEPGLAYFVMKYIPGRGLDEVIRHDGPQSPEFVQAVLRQVGSALDYAHRSGVVHRDIKSANIMLDDGGWAVLTDFGIAKTADSPGLTSSGMIIGTPAYMSPEQFAVGEVGPAADQYALGCVVFELLAGRRPMLGNTVAELMRAHMLDEPPRLSELIPECPRDLDECVHRMLAKAPQERFASLADAVASLRAPSQDVQERVSSEISRLARTNSAQRPRISQPVSPSPGATANSRASISAAPGSNASRVHLKLMAGGASAFGLLALTLIALSNRGTDVTLVSSTPDVAAVTAPAPSLVGDPAAEESTKQASPLTTEDQESRPQPPKAGPVSEATRRVLPASRKDAAATPANDSKTILEGPSKEPTVLQDTSVARPPSVIDSAATSDIVGTSTLVVGTRLSAAWLYIDDEMQSLPMASIRTITIAPGLRRIRITTNGCFAPWDTTFEARAGEIHKLNYKTPRCDPAR